MFTVLRSLLLSLIICGATLSPDALRAQSLDDWPLPPIADWPLKFESAQYYYVWSNDEWGEESRIIPFFTDSRLDSFHIYRVFVGGPVLSFKGYLDYAANDLPTTFQVMELKGGNWSLMYVDSFTYSDSKLTQDIQYVPGQNGLSPRRKIEYSYNELGQRTGSVISRYINSAWTLERQTTYFYDSIKRFSRTEVAFNVGGQLIQRERLMVEYDSLGGPASYLMQTSDHGNFENSKLITFADATLGYRPVVLHEISNVFDTLVRSSQSGTIKIMNEGPGNLATSTITTSGNAFVLPAGIPHILYGGNAVTLPLTFEPKVMGEIRDTIRIASQVDTVLIPITGIGRAGLLVADAQTIDLGKVTVGLTASREITLRNDGNIEAKATLSLQGDIDALQLPDATMELAAGQSIKTSVMFDPKAEGAVAAKLIVSYEPSVEGTSPLEILIIGEALLPESVDREQIRGVSIVRASDGSTQIRSDAAPIASVHVYSILGGLMHQQHMRVSEYVLPSSVVRGAHAYIVHLQLTDGSSAWYKLLDGTTR